MMLKKYYIYNKGTCTRVKLYGIDVSNLFLINGYELVEAKENAKYIIINTCSFLKCKEEYFIDFIKKVNGELKRGQVLIIIGCLPSIAKEKLLKINKNMILFGIGLNLILPKYAFSEQ